MLENLDNAVFFNDDIDLGNVDYDTVTFFSDDMGPVNKDSRLRYLMMIRASLV